MPSERLAVNKRQDSAVYQAASARVAKQLADLALIAGKRKKSDAER